MQVQVVGGKRERRFLRRLAERRQQAWRDAEPRVTDRRTEERRSESLTGPQLDARLRQLGIAADRRGGARRQQPDRRRK